MKYTTCVHRKRTAWRRNVQSQSYGRASKCAICIKLQLLVILKFPVPSARVRFNTRPILFTPRLTRTEIRPPTFRTFLTRSETRCWARRLNRFVHSYEPDVRRIMVRIPAEIYPFSKTTKQSMGPTQAPIHWVPGVLSLAAQ